MFIRRALQRGPGPLTKDISVDEFLRTRFDDEFADHLGTAMIRGIVGVDSKRISVSALLPQVSCVHVVYCLVSGQTRVYQFAFYNFEKGIPFQSSNKVFHNGALIVGRNSRNINSACIAIPLDVRET